MAKAKSTDHIPPFPPDIDRDSFGHWLSGFTDGEGTFLIKVNPRPRDQGMTTRFIISLRRDDRPILEAIQSYWQCGRLRDSPNYSNRSGNPLTLLDISSVEHLHGVVVPHFRRYPLRAKKRHDFDIWEQAVNLIWDVTRRPRRRKPTGYGSLPRWTESECDQFKALSAAIRQQRSCPIRPHPST